MNKQTVLVLADDPAILGTYPEIFRSVVAPDSSLFGEAEPHPERSCKMFQDPEKLLSWYERKFAEDQHSPLCVLDLLRPEIDGVEVAKRIRKIDQSIQIVQCSSSFDATLAEMCTQCGDRIFFMRKPFAADEFLFLADTLCISWERTRALEIGEEKLRSLVDSMSDGVVYYNAAGIAESCNPAALRILHRVRDEVVGKHADAIRPLALRADGSSFPKDQRPLARTLGQGEIVVDEILGIPSPRGTITWLQLNCVPVFERGKTRPAGAVVTYSDISRRMETERELRIQKLRLSDVADGTGAGLWEWNVPSREFIVDDRWAGIVGYTVEELFPMSIDLWTRLCHPDDLAATKDAAENHFRNNSSHYDMVHRVRHKDGSWIWIQDRGRVVEHSLDGSPMRLCGLSIVLPHGSPISH